MRPVGRRRRHFDVRQFGGGQNERAPNGMVEQKVEQQTDYARSEERAEIRAQKLDGAVLEMRPGPTPCHRDRNVTFLDWWSSHRVLHFDR